MPDAKEELIEYAYSKTVCRERPACCQPRDIDMVLWDADDTMWNIRPHAIASSITGKLVMVDENTLEVEAPYSKPTPASTPKKSPARSKKKRWWQETTTQDAFPDWRDLPEAVELEDILGELEQSIQGAGPTKEEEVILDEIGGWAPHQQKQVDNLIRRYGKGICKVYDVLESGTIYIDCRDDLWMLTKDGQLIGQQTQPPPVAKPAPQPAYQPKKLTITLLPTFRETIQKLKDRGIRSSIISLNTPGTVKRIVEAFGMTDEFVEIQDTWGNKGQVFDDIAKRANICPCNALFVDDTGGHVSDVSKKCGLALQIGKGKDVETPIEIFRYIKGDDS